MSKKILVINGRVIDPSRRLDQIADVLIENHSIVKVGKNLQSINKNCQIIDAKNKIVSPGFIDLHVHLREPGREDKETIATASRAAVKGGITTVVAMPNTYPVADNQTVLEYVLSKAKKEALINILVAGTITKGEQGKEIAEIWEMKNSGAVAVTDDGYDLQNLDVYLKALQYCKTHQIPVISHTEDMDLSRGGQMHEGMVSSELGLKGIPACCEDSATARLLPLIEETGHQVHFTHVSTKGSVALIHFAQQKGLKVTADATPHHFSLTDEALRGYNAYAKVNPPLRSEDHRQAILKGLRDGIIEVIATDHAPHLWTEKEREFDNVPPGIIGFETMLPLIVTNLVQKKILTLSQALAKITSNPARILGLNKGTLAAGADADITIFSIHQKQKIDRTKFESKAQNSPFHGMILQGVVTDTLVHGKIVVRGERIIV